MTEEELELKGKEIQLENDDKKRDAKRRMTWVALIAIVIYPLYLYFATDSLVEHLAKMSDMYFMSLAGIVAAYFGFEAWMSKKD